MDADADAELSCPAKLARVVLANCGPLSPAEVAEEAHLDVPDAEDALAELERADQAEPVCGMTETREQVYALQDGVGTDGDPDR